MYGDVLTLFAFLEMLRESGEQPQGGPPGPPGPGTLPPPPAPGQPAVFVPPVGPAPIIPAVFPPPGVLPPPAAPPVPVAPPVAPGVLPPMPAWPSPPTPGTLPPFPGPGWCPDTPVSQTVAARAAYWNPQLWDYPSKTVRKAYVQEQLGGSWVTFAAAWHPGNSGPQTYMATEAWKVCAAPPIAPVTPPPMPAPAVVPTPTQKPGPIGPEPAPGAWQTNSAYIKRYQAALSYLAHAIPMPSLDPLGVDGKFGPNTKNAVMNYQRAHGLTVDGEVGNATAASIDQTMGYAVPGHAVPAPGQAPTPAPATPPAGPPGLVSPYPGPGAYATNSQYIARVQNALTWLSGTKGVGAWNPQGVDGKDGPHTRAAVKAFQSAHGLTADGMAGAATAAALDAALSSP